MRLTPEGLHLIEEIANRYAVSVDAVMSLLQAVNNGGGTMAQFNHPELGGSGQWMQGGMTMVGDMFNNALKNKVDNLCSELSNLSSNRSNIVQPEEFARQTNSGSSTFISNTGGHWWPSELGVPSSSGSQNQTRYAIFPATQRLAIDINGHITIYNTLNHLIGGVGQQQSGDASVTFTSQFGIVRLADLPIVFGKTDLPEVEPRLSATVPPTVEPQIIPEVDDIFTKIERLAELRHKGIITEDEFSSKKAELMQRL